MFKKYLSSAFAMLLLAALNAQEVKFGKVSIDELKETSYPEDTTAAAAVLFRKVNVFYAFSESVGAFELHTDVHERIKIYKKEGFEHATKREYLYMGDANSDHEDLSGLKAITYNLKDGKIEESKLKGSSTFTKETSKYYKEESFTMPNITEGSVIEYQYTLSSPQYWSVDEIVLQYDIPIKHEEIKVSIPEYFVFAPTVKGYLAFQPKTSRAQDRINYSVKNRQNTVTGGTTTNIQQQTLSFSKNISEVTLKNVPALVEEPFVNNMNNYRAAIDYELQYVKFPNEPMENYTTSWEEVAKKIYESDNFGRQLNQRKVFKDHLAEIMAQASNDEEKVAMIFDFVRNHMNWNFYLGKYTDQGIKKAFEEKTGNAADINLMLVAMLNDAGVKSNPVLVSTRDNGVPLFPTRDGFNYVVASAQLGDAVVLMDATNKFATPNMLPTRALNWTGLMISEDGMSSTVSMLPQIAANTTDQMMVDLAEDGHIEGKLRTTHSGYGAYTFRNNNNGKEENAYLETLENKLGGAEIENYSIENKEKLGEDIRESYSFSMEGQIDVAGDKLYFNPLFFEMSKENPFKLDERKYPVDFVTPWEDKHQVMIKFPEGYALESKPENIKVTLPDDAGSFTYIINETSTGLQVMSSVKIDRAIFPSVDYAPLKEFFNKLVEKQNEKVVLKKL